LPNIRGAAGYVIDDGSSTSLHLPRPISHLCPRVSSSRPYKSGPGEINVPVSIGVLGVSPGDIVV